MNNLFLENGYVISIHAPPRRATGIFKYSDNVILFQFPPLAEGRLGSFK